MIEKQREKEFLFELERLCHSYNIIIINYDGIELSDANCKDARATTEIIEDFIDGMRDETMEDIR